ncbi:MAG: Crp/Fnr family transcriptional regulator [Muribaculaceae bacterium]|nr:Crp/Fnr family transcriptional regulator [Muribaculaceae bacterium]
MDNIFDKLLHLPLFQGVSQERLEEIVAKIPFHFLKFKKGEKIISSGDGCTHVRFVISGKVKMEYESKPLKFRISNELSAPEVISPDYLFGLDTSYPFNVTALEPCGILQVAKQDYITILRSDNVFLYNILNYLSRNSQSMKTQLLNVEHASVVERLALLVSVFTTQRSQQISLNFKQKDLCRLLGARRPAFMGAIGYLLDNDMIEMPDNSNILIKDRKQLLSLLKGVL